MKTLRTIGKFADTPRNSWRNSLVLRDNPYQNGKTGISNLDVSVLPELAKVFGVDMNALFAKMPEEAKKVTFTELPGLCYDAVLSLFLKARHTFYGSKWTQTEEVLQKQMRELKEEFDFPKCRCAYMVDEGHSEHGAVFLSDALTFIDRSYGGTESTVLFDLDRNGEMLSVLGNGNVRKVLKVIYEKLITEGEGGTCLTLEKLADASGLTTENVKEAAVQLRHIGLLDEIETMQKDGCTKEFCTRYCKHFIFVIAILRIAHICTSGPAYTTLMYRNAQEELTYDGPGPV